jgi:gluconolactonase
MGFLVVLLALSVVTLEAEEPAIVAEGAQLEKLWSDGEFTEGPAVGPDGCVYFSDIGNRILKFDPSTGKVAEHRNPSGRANGLAFDAAGRLLAAEGAWGGNRRISITTKDGKATTLADRWDGKRFNSPNDLCIDSRGRVYFTDPRYVGDEPRDLNLEAVYRIDIDGKVHRLVTDVQRPNGIALSPDESTLYVSDSKKDSVQQLLAFPLDDKGNVGKKRVVYDFGKARGIDGMCIDEKGNIHGAAGEDAQSAIYVISPAGKLLGTIPLPELATNCAFAGDDRRTLYITAGKSLYRIRVRTVGLPLRFAKP